MIWKRKVSNLRAKAGLVVLRSPLLFIARAREIVEKLLARDAGDLFLELVLLEAPCHSRHARNDRPDGIPVGSEREGHISEHILHFDAIRIQERALQHVPGYLKTDEAPIPVRRVSPRRDLEHVEAELRPDVRHRIIPIGHITSVFPPQLGIQHRHRAIGGNAVPLGIGGIVFQRAQSERIFVEVLRFADQRRDEIAAADVMREIAEKAAAERIISHVLNDAASVSVGVRLLQFLRRRVGESFEKQLLEGGIPNRIDDCFVGENRIAVRERGRNKDRKNQTPDGRDLGPLSFQPIAGGVYEGHVHLSYMVTWLSMSEYRLLSRPLIVRSRLPYATCRPVGSSVHGRWDPGRSHNALSSLFRSSNSNSPNCLLNTQATRLPPNAGDGFGIPRR